MRPARKRYIYELVQGNRLHCRRFAFYALRLPGGLVILTPQGKISRYLYGLDYSLRDLRLGLVDASANKIGSWVDQVLLRCYQYDPVTGRYTPPVMNIIRIAGLITVSVIGAAIFIMLKWKRAISSAAK